MLSSQYLRVTLKSFLPLNKFIIKAVSDDGDGDLIGNFMVIYSCQNLIQGVPKKTGICGKLSLRAIGLSKSNKLAHFWKIQEIL